MMRLKKLLARDISEFETYIYNFTRRRRKAMYTLPGKFRFLTLVGTWNKLDSFG